MTGSILIGKKRRSNSAARERLRWGTPEWTTAGCIFLIRFLFYLFVDMPRIEGDTHTYLEFTWRGFLCGERMPLYPLVIRLNRLLFHDRYLMGVVVCQILVSLVSVLYLYRSVRIATQNRGIACAAAFFYGGNPWLVNADVVILTESFAISITVFLLYHTVCYIRSHSWRSGMWMVLCILLAVLQKSAMFVYVPAYLIFMAIQYFNIKDIRKIVLRLSAALLGIGCLLLLYAGQVWKNANTFSVDKRGPRHMLIACLETGLYKNYPDRELVEEIDRIYMESGKSPAWKKTQKPILLLFGDNQKEWNAQVRKFNNYCIGSDPGTYVRYLLGRFVNVIGREYKLLQSELDESSPAFHKIYQIQLLLFPLVKIGHVYLICGAVLLLLIVKWRRNQECPWYYLGTAGMILVVLVSVIVGTFGSYERCTSYVLPFAFFGAALLLKDFLIWLEKCRE